MKKSLSSTEFKSTSFEISLHKFKAIILLFVLLQVLVAIFPGQSTRQKREDFVASEMQYFHAETGSWKPFPSMARLVDATKCICAEVVGNYLYVATEESGSHIMYRYDTVRNVWEKLPPFQNNYFSVGCMSSVNEDIYVISNPGLLQRYSLAQNDWRSGSKLPRLNNTDGQKELLVNVTAVSMRSKIYVLHGCYKEGRDNYGRRLFDPKPAVVHCFDPLSNVWRKKASTCHPHFNSSLFVDKNNLYVAGGSATISEYSRERMRASGGDAPVEVYDEGINSWRVVEQNRIPSNTLGAVELWGGEVYFIINKFPIDSGIRIPPNEVYKISLREWENSLERIDRTAVLCYLSVNREMLSTVKAAAKYPAVRKSP